MVFTAILTAHSMAGEEQLVFHDFLGIERHRDESVNHSYLQVLDAPKRDPAEEAMNSALTKMISAEQSAWPQGSCSALPVYHKPESIVRQGRQRESGGSREFSPQMGADAPETSPHLIKVSRFETLGEKIKSGHVEPCRDLIMQPQPMSSNLQTSQPSIAVKPSLRGAVAASRWDNSWHLASNCYTIGSEQLGLSNPQLDKLAPSIRRETTSGIVPTRAPADEGSRTGLKGSSAGILLNGVSTNLVSGATHNNLTSGKPWSLISAGSESSSQQATAPTSKQLTIFYGGQAHVFDDVPSDKADAIMTLAGSSGRSWTTLQYTLRSNDYVPGSKKWIARIARRWREKHYQQGKCRGLW